MMEEYEVEIKIPLNSPNLVKLNKSLKRMNAFLLCREKHLDHYLNHPCKDFAETDEAIRIREKTVFGNLKSHRPQTIIELTYKGPKVDKLSKSREEITIFSDNPQNLLLLFERLGFVRMISIRKERTKYFFENTTVCIDDVESLGLFIEFERTVSSFTQIEHTRDEILSIARSLGLDVTSTIRKSYLEMLLEKEAQ